MVCSSLAAERAMLVRVHSKSGLAVEDWQGLVMDDATDAEECTSQSVVHVLAAHFNVLGVGSALAFLRWEDEVIDPET
jgi:hypothetical protein